MTKVVGAIMIGTIFYYIAGYIASTLKVPASAKGLEGLVREIEMIFFWANLHAFYLVAVLSCSLIGWIVAKTYRNKIYAQLFGGVFVLYMLALAIVYMISNYS